MIIDPNEATKLAPNALLLVSESIVDDSFRYNAFSIAHLYLSSVNGMLFTVATFWLLRMNRRRMLPKEIARFTVSSFPR